MSERQGRYAVRIDANQREIERALVEAGYTVHDTHALGHGFPDLAVNAGGVIVLLEVKAPGGRMTGDEEDFFYAWRGAPVYMVRTRGDALAVCDAYAQKVGPAGIEPAPKRL